MSRLSNGIASDKFTMESSVTSTSYIDRLTDCLDLATTRIGSKPTTQIHLENAVRSTQRDISIRPLSPLQNNDTQSPTSKARTSTSVCDESILVGIKPSNSAILASSSANPNRVLTGKTHDKKKTQPNFTLGRFSEEGQNSTLEASPLQCEKTSFKGNVSMHNIRGISSGGETAIESFIGSYSQGNDFESSSIEGYGSDEQWEDIDKQSEGDTTTDISSPGDTKQTLVFQRVNSTTSLNSNRSLLTEAIRTSDHALTRQSTTSQSLPYIQEQFNSIPVGNSAHPSTSPGKITRQDMLKRELPTSIRQHLLRERQPKHAHSSAVAKRLKIMKQNCQILRPNTPVQTSHISFSGNCYHQAGW